VNAAAAINLARIRAQLSKRELARRAHTSPAAIVHYESGARSPTYPTLERIVEAAGFRPVLSIVPARIDRNIAGARLEQVLRFAAHMPHKPAARHLRYPRLPR
jgi:transcriptional regulator with XRE-family HTH domain